MVNMPNALYGYLATKQRRSYVVIRITLYTVLYQALCWRVGDLETGDIYSMEYEDILKIIRLIASM
jgi:hypothetical protein